MRSLLLLGLFFATSALAGTPRASSELKDDEGERHPASKAFDGLLSTGWAEAEMGDGTGAWLEISLDTTTEIQSVSLWPGNMSIGQRSLREYGRPRTVQVTLLGGDEEVMVEARCLDPGERGPLRTDIAIEGTARKIRFDFTEVYAGGIFNDLFVAEVAVNFVKGEVPRGVNRINEWIDSDSGQRAIEKNREEVIALYDRSVGAEFGDREALQELMDRAGDGAPHLRSKVVSLVPAGYRVHALPPDQSAIEALLKIKDSNAIPAIERAALRARGKAARTLQQQVDVFRAYQELVGGGRFNIPPYGTTGWEQGALQGLGEPLPIEIDEFGGVWVADVANNRVQRFDFDGRHEKTWGHPEAGITNEWFKTTRTHYVAGAQPGTDPGQFFTAVDLTRIPTKEGTRIGVLDGHGRITIIDEAGGIAGVIQSPADDEIIPGVGGEGHLMLLQGDRLAMVWGNEGWVYSLEGEQLSHFELEDGSPTGSVALKNKMGLIYGKKLVMYSQDGFRHGDVMEGALGDGFEAWDINADNEGKLWAVTDKGEAFKFKKPGKVAFRVQLTDYSLEVPRLAVYDGIVMVTDRDEIKRFDALELEAEQAQAAAAEALAGESTEPELPELE